MKALGLVVSDKKIFEICILKIYYLILWSTYATNWNGLNNFDRGPPRDHSCEVWSKSNKRFQRRCCWKKLLTHGRTDGQTMDDGQWAITKAHLEHFVLRWAKKFSHDGRRTTTDNRQRLVTIAHPEHFVLNWANKRGRSPEEKVKGHSGAINRGLLMLSTRYW